jgi:hypothetical protein
MRNQLTLIAIIFIKVAYSQVQNKTITGKVLFKNHVIANAHIINQKTNQGTNTSNFGIFEIPVNIGDTLHFSHINYAKKQVVISEKNMTSNVLNVALKLKIYELEEIILPEPKNSSKDSLQNIPIINAMTLNMPYAGTKGKKNYSVLRIRSGVVFSIDNFINFLNGNNKRRKKLKKITYEDDVLHEIRIHFKDNFFIKQLQIQSENIYPFLNYCFKDDIINHFKRQDFVTLKVILSRESVPFLKEIKTKN